MEALSDCLGLMHSTWLASSISCCFPQRLQDQPTTTESKEPAAPRITAGNTTQVCCEPPKSHSPPVYNFDSRRSVSRNSYRQSAYPRPLTSHRSSTWNADRLSVSSRPLSRMSFTLRKSPARRPTIGAPSEFRKVQSGRISPLRRAPAFRPLQLSIYLPGNELPDLPIFWEDGVLEEDGEAAGLERPAPALIKSKSDPLLLRHASSSFSIPRKPVASRSSSVDASRFSMESNFTLNTINTINDFPKPPRARSTDQLRSAFPERRSSIATTRSTQDFLDALDSRLPQPPPAALRTNPEPSFAIYRRASEQSLRLRTHLEERQSLEKRLPDLMEEVSPLSTKAKDGKMPPLSPISDHESIVEADNFGEKSSSFSHDWFQPSAHSAEQPSTHKPRSSSGSSTLLNPTLNLDPFHPDATVTTTIRADTPNSSNSIRNRFSQWLLKALPSLPPIELDLSSEHRSSTPMSLYSVSAPTHTQQSSMSSYWTRGSVDIEKAFAPKVRNVGVAF